MSTTEVIEKEQPKAREELLLDCKQHEQKDELKCRLISMKTYKNIISYILGYQVNFDQKQFIDFSSPDSRSEKLVKKLRSVMIPKVSKLHITQCLENQKTERNLLSKSIPNEINRYQFDLDYPRTQEQKAPTLASKTFEKVIRILQTNKNVSFSGCRMDTKKLIRMIPKSSNNWESTIKLSSFNRNQEPVWRVSLDTYKDENKKADPRVAKLTFLPTKGESSDKSERQQLIRKLRDLGIAKDDDRIKISFLECQVSEAVEDLCKSRLYKKAFDLAVK